MAKGHILDTALAKVRSITGRRYPRVEKLLEGADIETTHEFMQLMQAVDTELQRAKRFNPPGFR